MKYSSPLQSGILIKRYQRFLADIISSEKVKTTIYCPNTGAMTGCSNENDIVWYSHSNNLKRRYPYTWELTHTADGDYICVNTHLANEIVHEALLQRKLQEFQNYHIIQREVTFGMERSRIDFLLSNHHQPDCYLEVKSVTLEIDKHGFFPDAVTLRGQKHLRELQYCVKSGARAAILFLVQHSGIQSFSPARNIDPTYALLLEESIKCGVEVYCYGTTLSPLEITVSNRLPIIMQHF